MARLRTHHKRKMRAIKRDREAVRQFEEQLLGLTKASSVQAALVAFVEQFGKAMANACAALYDAFQSAFTPKPVMLEAEPFWDDWPEIIGE